MPRRGVECQLGTSGRLSAGSYGFAPLPGGSSWRLRAWMSRDREPPAEPNTALAQYRSAAEAVAESHSTGFLDTVSLLAPLGPRAFAVDGLHLSGAAYRLLLPALATAAS